MKADVRSCGISVGVVNLPLFTDLVKGHLLGTCAVRWTGEFVPFCFRWTDIFRVAKVDSALWLAELKPYTRVRRKFNQVYPNQKYLWCVV